MNIEMAALQEGTLPRSRMITYILNSSSRIHAAMHVEERVEYHSEHRDGCTPRGYMPKEQGDSLPTGFIKLDPWSNACGESVEYIPQ